MDLKPEDYLEPVCPFERCSCGAETPHRHHGERIPLGDIIKECDRLFEAERPVELGEHLRRWRDRARELGDREGELSILSEMMGHYRMTCDRGRGLAAVRDGFALMGSLGIDGTVSAGTIYINGATVLQSFGLVDEALKYYAEAFRCYNENLDPSDWRFAGLLNNMAAAYAEKGDVKRAETYYLKALDVLNACGKGMDTAVTYVNLAQLYRKSDPDDPMIGASLDCAMLCFDDPAAAHDGYYAHTCRKCASAFGEMGRAADARELNRRADEFHAGH